MISVIRLADTTLHLVFVSKKLEQDLKPTEIKPPIVNQQCIVYSFSCDLCDADYVGYTARHLHQRHLHFIVEHKNLVIGKHFLEAHGHISLLRESQNLIASSMSCFSSRNVKMINTSASKPMFLDSLLFSSIFLGFSLK